MKRLEGADMKNILLILMISFLVVSVAAPAYCDGPGRKLGRGLWNMFTFPGEIPNRISKARQRAGLGEAMTSGFIEGIAMMGFRLAIGMYETATFIIPIPENYEPILNDPEFLLPDDTN